MRLRLPGIPDRLSSQSVGFVHAIRGMELSKPPGVAETLDLSRSLMLLKKTDLDATAADETLGCVLKSADDMAKVRSAGIDKIVYRALGIGAQDAEPRTDQKRPNR